MRHGVNTEYYTMQDQGNVLVPDMKSRWAEALERCAPAEVTEAKGGGAGGA